MQTFDSLFTRELAALILREIERHQDALESNPFTDSGLAGVRYIQGQIAALRNMPTLMEEASKNASQDNR